MRRHWQPQDRKQSWKLAFGSEECFPICKEKVESVSTDKYARIRDIVLWRWSKRRQILFERKLKKMITALSHDRKIKVLVLKNINTVKVLDIKNQIDWPLDKAVWNIVDGLPSRLGSWRKQYTLVTGKARKPAVIAIEKLVVEKWNWSFWASVALAITSVAGEMLGQKVVSDHTQKA